MNRGETFRAIMSAVLIATGTAVASASSDSIPGRFSRPLEWRVSMAASAGYVPDTNGFLGGDNGMNRKVGSSVVGEVRASFLFNPASREGMLYKGMYQGLGLGFRSFFSGGVLGNPVSAYVFQGAPFASFSPRLSLGYEWQFGAAFGWKYYDSQTADNKAVVGAPLTAHMNLGIKLHYSVAPRWIFDFGIAVNHWSNGNTVWPNYGVNAFSLVAGATYVISPSTDAMAPSPELEKEADSGRWMYDIVAYGAWRKRVVHNVGGLENQLCPGRFGVAGALFTPLRRLNRWVAVGPQLDVQWDESAGLARYWVDGSYGSQIRFIRPPFHKQLSVGLSAHAELTTPIFAVNAGLGYDFLNPKGDKAFYQSLTLKAFVTRSVFLNVGYRLGAFRVQQNLMLGLGLRL